MKRYAALKGHDSPAGGVRYLWQLASHNMVHCRQPLCQGQLQLAVPQLFHPLPSTPALESHHPQCYRHT